MRMMIRVFLVIIFSILGLTDLNASDTSVPKPQELLKIYQKNLNKFRSCFYLEIDRERDDTSPVFHFAVEGDRVKAEYRELNNPDAVLEVALHHDALLTAILNRDLLQKEDESAIVVESQLSTVEDRLAYLCNVVGLGSFCGYMPIEDHNGKNNGMVDIVHAISAYDLETKADTIDEKSLILLQATGDNHTTILIWFDPSTNYEVKRIEKSISNAQPGERSRYISSSKRKRIERSTLSRIIYGRI